MSAKVGLVQANVGFSGQHYLPLSVGYLQAHAQAFLEHPEELEFLLPIYKPGRIEELSEKLSEAKVVAYSHYTWNANFNLALARRTKERNPSVINVFGGPHVPKVLNRRRVVDGEPIFEQSGGRRRPVIDRWPERVETFHKTNPFVDIACHGEGEDVFTRLLAKLAGESPPNTVIPSISYLDPEGRLVTTPEHARMTDLDVIPSPFLSGFFDALIDAYPDQTWIVMLETNRGCPFACTWCDWGSNTASKVTKFSTERICRELDWIGEHRIPFVFCADANFGILNRDVDIASHVAGVRARTGYPHKFSVQNTKNRQEQSYRVQKILFDAGLNNGVVVALQSVNPDTLKAIKRDNISHAVYLEIQQRFAKLGLGSMTEFIWPQPLETYASYVDGICSVIANGQHNRIQFNKLSILPNAELGDPMEHEKYGLEIVDIPVANIHGALTKSEDEIEEVQRLVVATSTCSREDHVRGLTFAWMVGLLHFNKLMQIPTILMHEFHGVGYRELFDLFAEGSFGEAEFPVMTGVRRLFIEKARAIQRGDHEFCAAPQWLNMYWPPEEYAMIGLYAEDKLEAFYDEAERAFLMVLRSRGVADPAPLADAVRLNQAMLKLPLQKGDATVTTSHNVWEFYQGILTGDRVPLQSGSYAYRIDRSEGWNSLADWCQKVVWWGNKKGAYLYGTSATGTTNLSGHY